MTPIPVTISTPLAAPPQQFSNIGTLINGGYRQAGLMLFLNGALQTEGLDYTRDDGRITMIAPPGQGDSMIAQVFAIGKQLGGATAERYIVPWTLPVAGPYDGAGLFYKIVFGATISGVCDGVNPVFTWQVKLQRSQIFKNGLLQTIGRDVGCGPTAMVFMPGAVPVAGDIITMLGY